jgi:hypothetical protein
MQELVHTVFNTVVGITATLLVIGLTGVIVLVATGGDTRHHSH